MEAHTERRNSLIGPTVVIRGELIAREERLTIMGTVEGVIDHDQVLTIHRDGHVDAEVRAQEVIVEGTVEGNIHGIKRVRITRTGRVNGNVYSQLFAVDEGAQIKGSVVMDADANVIEQRFREQTRPAAKARPAKKADLHAESTAGSQGQEKTRKTQKVKDGIGGQDDAKAVGEGRGHQSGGQARTAEDGR